MGFQNSVVVARLRPKAASTHPNCLCKTSPNLVQIVPLYRMPSMFEQGQSLTLFILNTIRSVCLADDNMRTMCYNNTRAANCTLIRKYNWAN